MLHLRLFCHEPTWTRSAAIAIAGVAALAVSGCNFSDFSRTSSLEPACTQTNPIDDAGTTPVAHWTFNDVYDASAPTEWFDSQHRFALVPGHDPTEVSPPTYSQVRLNGEGQSIQLNGHQFATYTAVDDSDPLFPKEFTISAWLALPPSGLDVSGNAYPVIWPILLTLGNNSQCGGFQLDIREVDPATGPELVFSYQFEQPDDAGSGCGTHELAHPIDNPSWAWGIGRWHHVAAAYTRVSDSQATLALYWDGVRTNVGSDSVVTGQLKYADLTLYVGSNAALATSSTVKFTGYLDDIAVFDRPLEDNELGDFVALTSTRPGPSGCRWNTYEQWDTVAEKSSYSKWASDSTADSLKVEIIDQDWGAGFISARLSPEKDLRYYTSARLDVTVPSDSTDKNFQFSLANGNDFCTWILPANGSGSYDIDLTRPSSCTSSNCQFPSNNVQWARIQSDWKDAAGQQPLSVSVTRLEFGTNGEEINPSIFGGAIGPKGWCWRPLAYELGAVAYWVGVPTSTSVAATLHGSAASSSRIAADFGMKVLDVSGCTKVEIAGQLPPVPGSPLYSFGLQDVNGSWHNWDINSNGPSSYISLLQGGTPSSSDPAYANFPAFDLRKISLLGIQKPWLYSGDTNIEIDDIRFYDDAGNECEQWSTP